MDENIFDTEAALLRSAYTRDLSSKKDSYGQYYEFISNTTAGQFKEALLLDSIKPLVSSIAAPPENDKTYADTVVDSATQFIQDATNDDDACIRQLVLLGLAVCCQQLYVEYNWVGPADLESTCLISATVSHDAVENYLSVDGEGVYSHSQHLGYLCLARVILLDARHLLQQCQTAPWWLMRCLQTQQTLLDERSPTLKATITELMQSVSSNETIMANDNYRDLAIQYHLEAGHLCYFYYEPSQADYHFRQAEKRCGLTVELTGAMGKRTKWQETDVAQLILSVQREGDVVSDHQTSCPGSNKPILPENVPLDDDTVLEEIALTGDNTGRMELSGNEQAVVLGLCHHHRKSFEGQGSIITEECLAYINCVLKRPVSWSVHTSALIQRTHWETECGGRRMQRCMMQLEELVNQWRQDEPPASTRLPLLYSVRLPPIWQIEGELGNFLMKIGACSSALEVFLRLKLWEDVIRCYTVLGRREKAEELIREQLALKETTSLWCYLGDVTREAEHYEKAWEVSGHRSTRAQKSLGYLFLYKGQMEECLPYFEKALELNALQVSVWFSLGCACLTVKKFEQAAKAFRRCVDLTSENYEAWSNLATAYIRSDQKPRAFLALQEAIKCDFENWRLWENFLLVATDIGEFQETMRAYHRMLDLRDKHTDTEVLKVLVQAVNSNIKDVCGEPSSTHRPALQQLFGRLTSKVTSDSQVWQLYAKLVSGGEEVTAEDQFKALQYLQKAHRCSIQVSAWEKDSDKCAAIAEQGSELAKACLQYSENSSDVPQVIQMLSSARLMLKGVLAKIKLVHTDTATQVLHDSVHSPCVTLEADLDKVASMLAQKKGS